MSRRRLVAPLAAALLVGGAVVLTPREGAAFPGFYVAGSDDKLVNGVTVVVLMRDGKRTVLSMQTDYEGPPEDYALVIPVPVILDSARPRRALARRRCASASIARGRPGGGSPASRRTPSTTT